MRSFGLLIEVSVVLAFLCVVCSQEVKPADPATNTTTLKPATRPEITPPPANVAPSNITVNGSSSSTNNIPAVVPDSTLKPTNPTTPSTLPATPNATTTVVTPTTPATTTLKPTEKPPVTTEAPVTTHSPKTESPPSTTALPIHAPTTSIPDRSFDGLSFIGGMVLAVGLLAIGVVALKYYRAREGTVSYFTL